MTRSDEYIQASEEKIFESFTCSETPQNPKKKNNKVENKRRFSDEQIRSLECIFESESKLEPRKKLQLARDLGLQPRQVAIWFQNKRARWKSKRIEQDYRKLRDEYDSLASRFESLKKEKESLQFELQKLNVLLETSHDFKENSREYGGLGSGHSNWRTEAKPRLSNDDQNEISKKTGYSEDIGYQLLKMDEREEVPLGSLEKWYSGDPIALLDQPCTSSHLQWLDFWS